MEELILEFVSLFMLLQGKYVSCKNLVLFTALHSVAAVQYQRYPVTESLVYPQRKGVKYAY